MKIIDKDGKEFETDTIKHEEELNEDDDKEAIGNFKALNALFN